jgi:hypothetical protein
MQFMLVDKNIEDDVPFQGGWNCNTLFPPVCKNNWIGQELWQTHKCEYVKA